MPTLFQHSRRLAVIVPLVAGLAACANVQPNEKPHEIEAAVGAWRDAFDRHDVTRITGLYDNDAVVWGTAATAPATTTAGIADYFRTATAIPQIHVILNAQYVRVMGDFATDSGTYTFVSVRDGQTVSVPARFTFTFRRVKGNWLIVAHHSSRMPQ